MAILYSHTFLIHIFVLKPGFTWQFPLFPAKLSERQSLIYVSPPHFHVAAEEFSAECLLN